MCPPPPPPRLLPSAPSVAQSDKLLLLHSQAECTGYEEMRRPKLYFILKSVNIKYISLLKYLSDHNIVHVNYLVYAHLFNQNRYYFAELRD